MLDQELEETKVETNAQGSGLEVLKMSNGISSSAILPDERMTCIISEPIDGVIWSFKLIGKISQCDLEIVAGSIVHQRC